MCGRRQHRPTGIYAQACGDDMAMTVTPFTCTRAVLSVGHTETTSKHNSHDRPPVSDKENASTTQ